MTRLGSNRRKLLFNSGVRRSSCQLNVEESLASYGCLCLHKKLHERSGFSRCFRTSENQDRLLGRKKMHPGNTLNLFSQNNSMPFKSISRDILGLGAVDEFISSNINKSVKLL